LASSETLPESRATARTLLFRVAGKVYGCDIEAVREIIPYRRATRLPGAPPFVQGLVNLRGTIVTVLDLGTRLDPARPPVRDGSIILATHGSRVVGVAVDEVMDVQGISEEHVEAHGGARDALIRGLGHLESDVVVLVDIHTLVTQVLL
jgi:purine-binding chemotaxis protein CheW